MGVVVGLHIYMESKCVLRERESVCIIVRKGERLEVRKSTRSWDRRRANVYERERVWERERVCVGTSALTDIDKRSPRVGADAIKPSVRVKVVLAKVHLETGRPDWDKFWQLGKIWVFWAIYLSQKMLLAYIVVSYLQLLSFFYVDVESFYQ